MTTTSKKHRPRSPGTYANELVQHFLTGSPKPTLPAYPEIKEFVDDAVLTDENMWDLSALLKLLLDIDKECQGSPETIADTELFWRDEVEEALAYFLAPLYCEYQYESLTFLPEYSAEIKKFNEDLNNYVLVLQLTLDLHVPKFFQNFQCLVPAFTLKLARLRVLMSFTDICKQGVRWTHHR
jgi:hypothetical protein